MSFVHKTIAEITALSDAGKDNYAKEKREHEADQVKEQIENATKPLIADNKDLETKLEKSLEGSVKLAGDVDTLVAKVKTLEAGKADQGGKENAFKKSFEAKLGDITAFKKKERGSVEIALKADTDYGNLTHSNVFNQLGSGVNDIAKKQVTLYDMFEKVPLSSEKYEYLYQVDLWKRCTRSG